MRSGSESGLSGRGFVHGFAAGRLAGGVAIAALVFLTLASLAPVAVAQPGRPGGAVTAEAGFVVPVLYNAMTADKAQDGGEKSFLAALSTDQSDGETSYCVGAFITPRLVLTAGHCLEDDVVSATVKGLAGDGRSFGDGMKAQAWARDPMFNGGYDGPQLGQFATATEARFRDIGLVLLDEDFPGATPLALPDEHFDTAAVVQNMYVWGNQRDAKFRVQQEFAFVRLQPVRPEFALKLHIVADLSSADKGWCVRDSGGPVTLVEKTPDGPRHLLVGIANAFFNGFDHKGDLGLAQVWGSTAKVPGCGPRLLFVRTSAILAEIRSLAGGLDADEAARIRVGGAAARPSAAIVAPAPSAVPAPAGSAVMPAAAGDFCQAADASRSGDAKLFVSTMEQASTYFNPGDCEAGGMAGAKCERSLTRSGALKVFGASNGAGIAGILGGKFEQCGYELDDEKSSTTDSGVQHSLWYVIAESVLDASGELSVKVNAAKGGRVQISVEMY